MWEKLNTEGTTGSENGEILVDEEYKNSCRITLEKCEKWYAITCGVYGAMAHTAFFDFNNYQEKYDAMKKDLQDFIDKDTSFEEELAFYHEFTTKY